MKRTAFFASFLLASFYARSQNDTVELVPVEVRGVRAGKTAPFTKTNLSKAQIAKQNLGQDLPFILNQTPSVVVSSDAGNGVGYTGLRIRGTDLSRINVTLNGIPYNDPESQGVFFVDLPDFASSVSSLQIQRGVGTSSNGPGAFGATINMSTNERRDTAYLELFNTFGSFDTRRHTVKLGTGLLNNHFTLDARLSRISSDGFIDRASSDLSSYYLSGAWQNSRSTVRLNVFSGKEKTYQAWNGVPEHKLFFNRDSLLQHYYNNIGTFYFTKEDSANLFGASPRQYNMYLYPNQTDNYQQDHYQLFFNHQLRKNTTLSTALFLTHGEGYYEQFRYRQRYSSYGLPNVVVGTTTVSRTNLIRRLWLKNDLYGGTFSLTHRNARFDYAAGGSLSRFEGTHFGRVTWAQQGGIDNEYQWYHFPSRKDDGNIYGKIGFQPLQRLHLLLDLQYRYVAHQMNGTRKFPKLSLDTAYHFFNPKAGIRYTGDAYSLYASYAVANREPNRSDYETGATLQIPKTERLHDLEAGLEHNGKKSSYGATLYYMQYKNQLVLTGKINDVGDPLRINVPRSYRLGLETWGSHQLNSWLALQGNLTVSRNRLQDYVDFIPRYNSSFALTGYDTLRFSNAPISFSPSLTTFAALVARPVKSLEITLSGKSVSRQFLDNTGSEGKSLRGYYVNDLQARYLFSNKAIKGAEVVLQINNLFDRQYESNGYTYSYRYTNTLVKENFYFPMAGINFMAGLNIKL